MHRVRDLRGVVEPSEPAHRHGLGWRRDLHQRIRQLHGAKVVTYCRLTLSLHEKSVLNFELHHFFRLFAHINNGLILEYMALYFILFRGRL